MSRYVKSLTLPALGVAFLLACDADAKSGERVECLCSSEDLP
jgi:hypothetical protein